MIHREDSGAIAIIRLDRGRVSALDLELCQALTSQLADLRVGSPEAVVLTGTGSSFSAGVDLVRLLEGGTAYIQQFLPAMAACFEACLTFPKPLVGAINGHAIAGGCILATTCDHAVLAEGTARMGLTELAVGVPFPVLPLEITRARVPEPGFHELIFGARTVLPDRALALGLVHELAPTGEVLARAVAHAQRLAAFPAHAFRLAKQAMVAPVLARTREAAAIDAEVTQTWSESGVLDPVRRYVEELKQRSRS